MKQNKNLKKLLGDAKKLIDEKTDMVMFDGKEFKLFDPITEITSNDYTTINSKKVVSEKLIVGNRIPKIIRCVYEYNDKGQTVRIVKKEESKKIVPINRTKDNSKETMRFEYYKNGKLKSIISEDQRYDYMYRSDRTIVNYQSKDRNIYTVKDNDGVLIRSRIEVGGLGIVNKFDTKKLQNGNTVTKEMNNNYNSSGELVTVIRETNFYDNINPEPFYKLKVEKDMTTGVIKEYSIEYIVDEHGKYIGYIEKYRDDKYNMEFHYQFVFDKKGRIIEVQNEHHGMVKINYRKGYEEKISHFPVQGITSIERIGKNKSEYIEVYKDTLKIKMMMNNLSYSVEINGDQIIYESINFRKKNKEYCSEYDIGAYTNILETYDKEDNLLESYKLICPNIDVTDYIKSLTGMKFGLDTISIFTNKKIVEEVEYAKKEKSRKDV